MDPVTTLLAARVGMNLLGNLAGGLAKIGQPPQPSAPPTGPSPSDPLAFQKILQKVATSPAVQNAYRLEAAGIRGMNDVPPKMGEFAARVVQDPAVQRFLQGEAKPVEIKFLGDGVVTVQTTDGRSRTIRLENPDARAAAQQAENLAHSLRAAGLVPSSPAQAPGATPPLFALRYRIGEASAQLLG